MTKEKRDIDSHFMTRHSRSGATPSGPSSSSLRQNLILDSVPRAAVTSPQCHSDDILIGMRTIAFSGFLARAYKILILLDYAGEKTIVHYGLNKFRMTKVFCQSRII